MQENVSECPLFVVREEVCVQGVRRLDCQANIAHRDSQGQILAVACR